MSGLVSILLFSPDVSRPVTQRALRSIEKYADVPYELIIDDDKSPTWTITRAINRSVAKSKGEHILIFNDDCEATPHFLSEMLKVMESDQRIGIVGCKILFLGGVDHGLIQSPGIQLYSDGSAEPWLRCPEDDIRFNHVREIMGGYVQGSCYLIRREAFADVGGIDEVYGRGMFDETDLQLRMMMRHEAWRWRVMYAPVPVYHGIGGENTVTNSPSRLLYEGNRRIFAKRYGKYLAHHKIQNSQREHLRSMWRRTLRLRAHMPIQVRALIRKVFPRQVIAQQGSVLQFVLEDPIWKKEVAFATSFLSWEDTVLDLGCGKRITQPNAIGVDMTLNPQSVDIQGTQRPTILCDVHSLPFREGSIGYVTSIHSFEHFKEPSQVLREIRCILKAGRYAGIVIPRPDLTPDRPDHIYKYMPSTFAALASMGFDVVARDDCIMNWSFGVILRNG